MEKYDQNVEILFQKKNENDYNMVFYSLAFLQLIGSIDLSLHI